MTWKTHLIGGVQAGILLAVATGAEPQTAVLEIGAASLGSLLPDLDHPDSKISRSDLLIEIVSKGLSKVTKHRREVHTVWASFLFGILIFAFLSASLLASATGTSFLIGFAVALIVDMMGGKIGSVVGLSVFLLLPFVTNIGTIPLNMNVITLSSIAVFLGCISHLIYDSANRQGIMWLHPFKRKRYHFMNIQTMSREEDYFCFAMLLLTIFLFIAFKPLGLPMALNLSEIKSSIYM